MSGSWHGNDRYLREFVEALHLCPYARRCREEGKLHRRVIRRREEALAAIREIEAMPEDAVEVALLIFPEEPADGRSPLAHSKPFARPCASRCLPPTGPGAVLLRGFHPDLPRDLLDASRAVRFIRRSPDPTLQLVRASVLIGVRGGTAAVPDTWTRASCPLETGDGVAEPGEPG